MICRQVQVPAYAAIGAERPPMPLSDLGLPTVGLEAVDWRVRMRFAVSKAPS